MSERRTSSGKTERVVFRVRCAVTEQWKITDEDWRPVDYPTREAAQHAARYLKHWRIVKVTIRKRERT